MLPFVLLAAALFACVSAHGYVSHVTIEGDVYAGNLPGRYTLASPIRTVSSVGPVQNTSDPDLACGVGAVVAQLDAVAVPGDAVNFTWVSGGGGNWPHEVGPVLTYMASCENATSCADFNTSSARWFKINQVGKQSDGVGWVQQDIMLGENFNVTVPEGLAPGGYLIRNEIIGLQNAMSPGGAEFFPSCTQVQVVGNGTGMPSPNDTVSFPGAYNATDPGVLVDVYTNPNITYIFPGPPIATIVNITSQMNDTSDSTSSAPAAETYEEPLAPETNPDAMGEMYMPLVDAMPALRIEFERERRSHSRVTRHSTH